MTTATEPKRDRKGSSKAERYVSYLRKVCASSGPRSQLRRCARNEPAEAISAHRYVAPWVADDAPSEVEAAYYCAASMFAEYAPPPEGEEVERTSKNFGRWVGEATLKDSAASTDSVINRLHHLVRLDGPNMRLRLPYLISSLGKDHRSHLPWACLINDLSWWEKDERVAKRWLQDFYRVINPDPDLNQQQTPLPTED